MFRWITLSVPSVWRRSRCYRSTTMRKGYAWRKSGNSRNKSGSVWVVITSGQSNLTKKDRIAAAHGRYSLYLMMDDPSPSKLHFVCGVWNSHCSLVHNPYGISIRSSSFAGLSTDRQTDSGTDHATPPVMRGRIYLCSNLTKKDNITGAYGRYSWYFTMGHPSPLKLVLCVRPSGPPSDARFLGPQPIWHLGSVCQFLQSLQSWQTDHTAPSVTVGRMYVCRTAMWPNNPKLTGNWLLSPCTGLLFA